ncbi:hypothetical protein ACVMB3_005092 [Sinorhizobium meliloti]
MSKSTNIHLSASDAWASLSVEGGLEPEGRDIELVESIRKTLDPQAPDINAALSHASTDQFVRCFFEAIQPFTEMFRDILSYYKRAGATQGRRQFEISIEEKHLDLADFENFIQLWNDVPGEIDVPIVDRDAMHAHWNAWKTVPALDDKAHGAARDKVYLGEPDLDAWLSDYRSGRLGPVPSFLWIAQQEPGFKELAAIGVAALETILDRTSSRRELHELVEWSKLAGAEPFTLDNLGYLESDHWLGVMVAGLFIAGRLDSDHRQRIAQVLVDELSHLPTRKFRADVSFGDLRKFLSLPIWKKRHELYAVWVFTEILTASGDHDVRLHHDNGRIAFEFRETLLASVESAVPNLQIFTEKKSPIINPVGKGRKENVQPDFSIWESARSGSGKCVLVVEVKHYKKSKNRSFADVLADYAVAHPDAKIVLANYGPIGDVLSRLQSGVKARCTVVENLNPLVSGQRQLFRQVVDDTVGKPQRAAKAVGSNERAKIAVAVDVSRSMHGRLTHSGLASVIKTLALEPIADVIYPIDQRLHDPIPVALAASELVHLSRDVNALGAPLAHLLGIYEEVIVITDDDGLNDLAGLGGTVADLPWIGAVVVRIRR